MAKIENKALRDLHHSEEELLQKIYSVCVGAEQAKTAYDKFVNEEAVLQKELSEIRDAIATLTKPKKAKNVSKD